MRIVDKVYNTALQNVSFDDLADEYYTYHKGSTTNYFKSALNNLKNWALLPAPINNVEYDFVQDLINDFEIIIKATPDKIPAIIAKLSAGNYKNIIVNSAGNITNFGKQLKDIFNYKAFRSRWKASWFCERLQVKACLYCNAQFALAIGKEGAQKKLLFQLDHFYSKSEFPYLSLTMGNLVPSCSTCNNSKSDINFNISTHIHPYYEDINLMFNFKVDDDKLLQYLLGSRDHSLLKPELDIHDSRFDSYAKIFSISDIYNKHTDIVEEMLMKKIYYTKSRVQEIRKEFRELTLSESTIDRFILGNYSLDSEINNRPLAKLSRDIARQLQLFKGI